MYKYDVQQIHLFGVTENADMYPNWTHFEIETLYHPVQRGCYWYQTDRDSDKISELQKTAIFYLHHIRFDIGKLRIVYLR